MNKEEVRREIGGRLREWRLSMKLSQEDVAARMTVKRQTVSKWEKGGSMPTADQWYALGRLFGASLDYLVYGIRTIPVSEYAIMAKVFERPGIQPPAAAFDSRFRLPAS